MAFDKSKFVPRFLEEAGEYLGILTDMVGNLSRSSGVPENIGDCIRAAHTLKGSAKILGFKIIGDVALRLEDVLRSLQAGTITSSPPLAGLIESALKLLRTFVSQVEKGEDITTDVTEIIETLECAARGEFKGSAETSSPEPEAPSPASSPGTKGGGFDRTKFVKRFVDESREHIDGLNEGLINLEAQPGNPEILDQIFRTAHTLKGASKILGLKSVSQLAHTLEDALDALRTDKIRQSRPLLDLLFRGVDQLAELIERVATGDSAEIDLTSLMEALEAAARGEEPTAVELPGSGAESGETNPSAALTKKGTEAPQPLFKSATSDTVRINTSKLDETVKLMGEIVSNHIRMKQSLVDIEGINKLSKKYLDLLTRVKHEMPGVLNGQTAEVFEMAQAMESKMRELSAQTRDVMSFQTLVTDELREKVLRMRMLPLSTVLDGFPRLVRDISAACRKPVNLEIRGGETELDKKIIEKIGDPLLHMVRNSIDHGIEPPEERKKTEKPETGRVTIEAGYEGGHVLIKIEDDGGGISVDKIREKAAMKKLFDEETLERMPDSEIINLIFRPAFSTSQEITEVSGRGVGMDVVHDNIVKALKGSIQIETELGEGTTFFIRLPLTLAIMRVMLVSADGALVALPLNSITEILRVPASSLIEVVNRRAVSLREQIVPVANLRDLLGLPPASGSPAFSRKRNQVIVMVAMGTEMLGLMVDEIITEEDMEIKPLPEHMKENEMVSGVTLSGKNEIVLLLHVPKLFELARDSDGDTTGPAQEERQPRELHILVVDDSVSTRQVERSILTSQGYQVDVAGDGQEALQKCLDKTYDLILTDIEMPRLDGFGLTEQLRREKQYRHVPIVILSSRHRDEDKRRGMEAGANAYLVKGSFDPAQLVATVRNLVG